ncbi:MAG: nicotinate-nucleotide adenylyltransferase [Candidatus Omnitrophica bacterium]|nr:nicotinate-nucleotide adenylyltransferase [Candidatus Omnitrophota bacterium]
MRIGILGGTFNPVHLGHLILAEEVREKLDFERLIFVPANLPPHKDTADIAPAEARFEMIRRAIAGNAYLSVSDAEIRRNGRSYTIDTVREFREAYPGDDLFFITGSDLLNYLDEWKDLKEITGMVHFVVATRPGYPLEKIPPDIRTVPIRAVDISAFEIRGRVREGKSFRYLVPGVVYEYIREKNLYG